MTTIIIILRSAFTLKTKFSRPINRSMNQLVIYSDTKQKKKTMHLQLSRIFTLDQNAR